MNTEQNYVGGGDNATQPTQTAPSSAKASTSDYKRRSLRSPDSLRTPFQAALLFTAEKQGSKPGFAAYVCYLNGQRVVSVERLQSLHGHNPSVNLKPIISHVRAKSDITGVIIATWHHSTSEDPYAMEFVAEADRQYDQLSEAGIKLVDNLRLSKTGAYSYYGDHSGPYDVPLYDCHEKSVCRLYK